MTDTALETSENLPQILQELGLPKAILSTIKKLNWEHPTFIQSALFSLAGKRQHFLVETGQKTGKTVGAVLFALSHLIKHKNGNKICVIVPHKNFRGNVYNSVLEVLKGSMVKLGVLSRESSYSEPRNIYVIVDTFENFAEYFRDQILDAADLSGVIVDETEYSGTFSNIHRLIELISYFKAKVALQEKSVFVLTSDAENECVEPVKNSFGVRFTVLKDIKKDEELDHSDSYSESKEEAVDEEGDIKTESKLTEQSKAKKTTNSNSEINAEEASKGKSSTVLSSILSQYFLLASEKELLSAIFILYKFKVFQESTIIVTQDLTEAYRLKMFLDAVGVGIAQVFNQELSLNIRAYHLSTLNSGTITFLIVTKDFLQDLKTNRAKLNAPRNLKNLIFFKCDINYDEYVRFMGHLRAIQSLNTS